VIGAMNAHSTSLPGSIWGITTFFNPGSYNTKYKNFKKFQSNLVQQGLPLLVVELAFSNADFELSQADSDILIQVRSRSILWQKERLLNLALTHLPKDCDKVVWLDSDIIFQNNDWIHQTSKLLEIYRVIQPFSEAVRLPKDFSEGNWVNARAGFDPLPRFSAATSVILGIGEEGHPGYAWATRRETIQELGFFDLMVVGGADRVMSATFLGIPENQIMAADQSKVNYSVEFSNLLEQWQKNANILIQQSVSFVPGFLFHLNHGENKNRNYVKRHELLKKFQFNPKVDLALNQEGVWEWSSNRVDLQNAVRDYFLSRREDD